MLVESDCRTSICFSTVHPAILGSCLLFWSQSELTIRLLEVGQVSRQERHGGEVERERRPAILQCKVGDFEGIPVPSLGEKAIPLMVRPIFHSMKGSEKTIRLTHDESERRMTISSTHWSCGLGGVFSICEPPSRSFPYRSRYNYDSEGT